MRERSQSEISQPDAAPPVEARPHRLPGDILRQAREVKQLPVAAIATQLNLDLRTVEALESNDQARLPAPIFVRGYLRSYARLVGVAETDVLKAYQALAPEEPTPQVRQPPRRRRSLPNQSLQRRRFPWRSLFGLLLLLLLALAAYRFGPALLALFRDEPAPPTEDETALSLPQRPQASASIAPVEARPALDLPLPQAGGPVAEPEAALPEPLEWPLPPGASPAESTLESGLEPATESAPVRQATAAVPGQIALQLHFKQDSWVEIRDSTQKRLLHGLMLQGTTRTLSGSAPVEVILGNSLAVELQVDGQVFDHSRYNRGNVARFSLPSPR